MNECPKCQRWSDVGPEFNADSTRQRWNCGICGEGPAQWHETPEAAEAAWNSYASEVTQ